MSNYRRKIELVVLSDIHLGTHGCHAKELARYLSSIKPETLVLNGDIIDMWQFKKRYWPKPHMKVVKQVLNFASKGTKVYYITGNHDETLRRFDGLKMGRLHIQNKLELLLGDQKVIFFHGDVFDIIIQHSKWLAKLGAIGYDALISLNLFINRVSRFFGRGNVSLSKRIKDNVKTAVKYINKYEETVADYAIQRGFDNVVCGHIHQPVDKIITDKSGRKIRYLNSGDWIENLTTLEYDEGAWKLFNYRDDIVCSIEESGSTDYEFNNKVLFNMMFEEFQNSR
ncbi:MAG: UDP-2,3-diacylglucosamine diphosphatase [Bacteroidales bacterium]|nr:UDP-2,3-diacylglucosamine diphosphatase [Bacteroidales bacterium]